MSQRADALIAEARRYLGVTEEPKNSNRGVEVDYWIRETGLDPKRGLPWCMAFVNQMGRQALGHTWPCPRTASVATLAAWAATQGSRVLQASPARGDLFLLWSPALGRFAHVGIITEVDANLHAFNTIEGNTNGGGGREGFGVFARQREVLKSMRFVRWEAA